MNGPEPVGDLEAEPPPADSPDIDSEESPGSPNGEPQLGETPAFEPEGKEQQAKAECERLIRVRLSPDNMTLELNASPGSEVYPMPVRVESVMQRIEPLGVTPMPDPARIEELLLPEDNQTRWLAITKGTPAVQPVHGSFKACVPSVPPVGKDRFHVRVFVRQGDPILRITPARDGIPGVDLLGRTLPAAPARALTLPAGEHTVLFEADDGPQLVADCDGTVYFDHLQYNIQPMQVVNSKTLGRGRRLETDDAVFVPENVPSATKIVAGGDIYVGGDVDDSDLRSTGGTITVLGCVTGHRNRHCILQAKGDIMVASALHVDIRGEQDVHIQTQARYANISAARHLILLARLRSAMYDVDLQVGGAVIPLDKPGTPPDVAQDERRVFDESCDIIGQIGSFEGTEVVFHPCNVNELSLAAASMFMVDIPPLSSNRTVYLKFALPGARPIQIVARTLVPSRDKRTMVAFRQVTHQDEMAITAYLLALRRARVGIAGTVDLTTAEDIVAAAEAAAAAQGAVPAETAGTAVEPAAAPTQDA